MTLKSIIILGVFSLLAAVLAGLFTYKTRPLHNEEVKAPVFMVLVLALHVLSREHWALPLALTIGTMLGIVCEYEDFDDEHEDFVRKISKNQP